MKICRHMPLPPPAEIVENFVDTSHVIHTTLIALYNLIGKAKKIRLWLNVILLLISWWAVYFTAIQATIAQLRRLLAWHHKHPKIGG